MSSQASAYTAQARCFALVVVRAAGRGGFRSRRMLTGSAVLGMLSRAEPVTRLPVAWRTRFPRAAAR